MNDLVIEGIATGEISCKRLYLDGIKAMSKCPACQKLSFMDFKNSYLSYPTANSEITLYFYCVECDAEWQKKAKFNVSLEVINDK